MDNKEFVVLPFKKWGGARFASLQTAADSPTGTTSLTDRMLGLNATITPAYSGRIMVTICGSMFNDTVSDGVQARIAHGTGTAPANGAAATGTAVGGIAQHNLQSAANTLKPFSLSAIITGLALGVAAWIDLQFHALVGGTGTIQQVAVAAHEF